MPLTLRLLLLLLLPGAAATLPLGDSFPGTDSRHLQEMTEIKKNGLLTFLDWWNEWSPQAGAVPFVGGETRKVTKRQDSLPPRQSTRPEKSPCKNFFWKTFSSCK
ncbi:PREDICTED: cortistatin [Chrysochloris asiatica]|uniref:Cortistatin n=1 Tax=Chrysochloris asiatica TaxID=185453 RepID=A0A9B0TRU3_CHRAS|nr:PREDICTED: cortistatin [Chrysochloris asiatica]